MIDEPVGVAHDCGFPRFAVGQRRQIGRTGRRYFQRRCRAGGHQCEIRARFLRAETAHFGLWQMGALMHTSGVGELKPKGLQYTSQHMADAGHQEASMPEINTRFLFTLALEIQVSSLGDTPYGRRRMFHFDGGSFDGPKLKGKVLPGGGGWSFIRRDDVMEVDARLILDTNDNHQIYAAWKGLRHGPKEVMDRLYQGELVDPGAYYFRTTPYFETSSEKYSWMNRICSIASGSLSANARTLDVFQVL